MFLKYSNESKKVSDMKKVTLNWCIQDTLKFQCKLHPGVDMFCVPDQSDPKNMLVKVGIDNDKSINNSIEMNLETVGNVPENLCKVLLELRRKDYVIGNILVIQNQVIRRRNTNGEMGCTYAFDVEDNHYKDTLDIIKKYS